MDNIGYERAIEDMRGLVRHRERVEASLNRQFVEKLAWHRGRGVPWTVLAEGLGVRKQAAHQMWAAAVRERLDSGTPTRPDAAEPALW